MNLIDDILLYYSSIDMSKASTKIKTTCRSITKWMDMTVMPVHFVRFDSGFRFWNSLALYYVRLKLRMANMTVTIQQANGLRQLHIQQEWRVKKTRTNTKRMEEVRSEWDSWVSECWRTVVIKCFYRSRCILCVACLFEHEKQQPGILCVYSVRFFL